MTRVLALLAGIGTGAALMYLFDPNGGRRRRALIRDKAVGLSHDLKDSIGKRSRDLKNRAQGLLHEAKSIVSTDNNESEAPTAQSF